MSNKYEFVTKMKEDELKMRIKTTGNPSFKKALEAELATRSGSIIEGEVVEVVVEDSQEAVESIPEEVDTNVPVEAEEAPTDSEEAVPPVKRGRKAAK